MESNGRVAAVPAPTPGLLSLCLQLHLSSWPHLAPEKPEPVPARPLTVHGSLWDPETTGLSQASGPQVGPLCPGRCFRKPVSWLTVSVGRPGLGSELGPLPGLSVSLRLYTLGSPWSGHGSGGR